MLIPTSHKPRASGTFGMLHGRSTCGDHAPGLEGNSSLAAVHGETRSTRAAARAGPSGGTRRLRPTVDAVDQRHLPRLGAGGRDRRQEARLPRSPSAGLEGIALSGRMNPRRMQPFGELRGVAPARGTRGPATASRSPRTWPAATRSTEHSRRSRKRLRRAERTRPPRPRRCRVRGLAALGGAASPGGRRHLGEHRRQHRQEHHGRKHVGNTAGNTTGGSITGGGERRRHERRQARRAAPVDHA